MGIFPYTISGMLTGKYMKMVKKDGWIRTWQRAHKASRTAQDIGGLEGAVVCVGQDHFGNRYFEDLDTDAAHCRRWVEYSNYHMNFGWGTDRVPPKWNGWLSGTYDDVPTDDSVFVEHPYIKEWETHQTGTPNAYNTPGSNNPFAQRSGDAFRQQQLEKHHTCMQIANPDNVIGQDGKKSLVERRKVVEDPMESY